jgi:hypothetical protein
VCIGGAKGDRTPDLMTASPGRPLITRLHSVMLTQHLQRVDAISRKVDITAFHCVSMKICHKIVTNLLAYRWGKNYVNDVYNLSPQ